MAEMDFLAKLLRKIEKIDRESLENYIRGLNAENDFLRSILNSFSEGVVVAGPDGKLLFVSQGAKAMLGIAQSEMVRGRQCRDVIEDRELLSFVETNRGPHSHALQQEIEMLVPHHVFLSVSAAPLFDRDEKFLGTSFLLVNTTFPRERERQLRALEKIQSLTSLAAGIAHEIGNPLNSINIHLKLLQKELEAVPAAKRKESAELLDTISSETRRLDEMVRNFLRATRRKPVRLKEENINEVLQQAARVLEPEIKRSKARLHLKLTREMPLFLIDAEKMLQVFINLIKNALESMPRGGTIRIVSLFRDKVCTVIVADEGTGIPPEEIPRIFEAYYTTKEHGSGLGLMIVQNIIQEHGGRIEVKSETGKGTAFTIHLPMKRLRLQLPDRPAKSA